MTGGVTFPREQVVQRLRDESFTFKRQADRVELYRQRGTHRRVSVPRRDLLTELQVRVILRQAGLEEDQIEKFLRDAVCA